MKNFSRRKVFFHPPPPRTEPRASACAPMATQFLVLAMGACRRCRAGKGANGAGPGWWCNILKPTKEGVFQNGGLGIGCQQQQFLKHEQYPCPSYRSPSVCVWGGGGGHCHLRTL